MVDEELAALVRELQARLGLCPRSRFRARSAQKVLILPKKSRAEVTSWAKPSFSNGYCGMDRECVEVFNEILEAEPDLKIVVHSAWRYLILSEQMTLKGFESMLLTHGVNCRNRIVGHTAADERFLPRTPTAEDYACLSHRADAILTYAAEHGITDFVVLDDLPVPLPQLVQTDSAVGLTRNERDRVLARLCTILKNKHLT